MDDFNIQMHLAEVSGSFGPLKEELMWKSETLQDWRENKYPASQFFVIDIFY